jgi:glycosyltransferase involved in cell wall biosynthesis
MKVLWLASWYPNKLHPLNGDFIQRHAKAVSLYEEITVIHLCRDEKGSLTRDFFIEEMTKANLTELIVYYHSFTTRIKLVDRFFSALKYQRLYKKIISDTINKTGRPDLVHVHVTMNAGLLALWLKKKWGLRYVVTEHWTGLLKEAINNFYNKPLGFQMAWKKIVKKADSLSVVSKYLAGTIRMHIMNVPIVVIPNVVDTSIFFPINKMQQSVVQFIHISRMDYQKNPEAILKAFQLLKEKGIDFSLKIFSNEAARFQALLRQYNLLSHVKFYEEVSQPELVKYLQQADALILYSRYETFGCVVPEANACGLPVIVSDIPPMHELVTENQNGIFAGENQAELLAEKLEYFIKNKQQFNTSRIAQQAAELYNFSKIGQLFSEWYHSLE